MFYSCGLLAFMSDETGSTLSDNNPPSEVQAPIGVTEKIRRFLNHIHHLDLTSTTSSSGKKKMKAKSVTTTVPSSTATNRVTMTRKNCGDAVVPVPNSTANQVSSRSSRHSKCFLPYEPPSPRKSPKVTTKSSPRKPIDRTLSSSISSLNRKRDNAKLVNGRPSKCDHPPFHSPTIARKNHANSELEIHSMRPERDGSGKKPGKSRKRAESIGSIVSTKSEL